MTKSVLRKTGTKLKLVTLLFMVKVEGTCLRVVFIYLGCICLYSGVNIDTLG